ncbi:polymorphic toxin type 17 domain-containing protein [Legionella fairfieldensis]|uniref:polymorphic toxin type 17 domain-containing protein n=1 Tax=Legionella fairfieldensis TaxID=45064 RepID=UPI000491DB88|nr:polymorphic toxin type 17 domain-containing protein [Legionella fairfieldensis]
MQIAHRKTHYWGYKKLSLELHPDKVAQKGGTEDEKQKATFAFQSLQSAYQVLSDPEKREAYNREGGESRTLNPLPVPQDLERPSANWACLKKVYEEGYQQHPLKKVKQEDRAAVLKTAIPLANRHFSPLYYQNLYVLTRQNEQDKDIDESYSDVFALIDAKQRWFGEPLPIETKLNLTPELALIGLLDFLKGKYYGLNLVTFQTSLEIEISKNTSANKFYRAILRFISVKDLKKDYQEALNAVHALYDAALEQYKAIERQAELLAQIELKAQDEYRQQMDRVKSAQERFTAEAKACDEFHVKVLRLRETLAVLEKEIQTNKVVFATSEQTMEDKEAQFEQFENTQYTLHQALVKAEEQYAITQTSMNNARDAHTAQLKLVEPLEKRIRELDEHQKRLRSQKFNERFLDLIESKYYKITLASIVSHYWHDTSPNVTPEKFAQIAIRFNAVSPELKKKYTGLGQTLLYADERIKKLGQDLTMDQYCEHASFFFDLYATVPILAVKVNAIMLAGLCWQMATHKIDDPAQQMALEALSLRMYQIAIQVAIKSPVSYALYVMIHVPKYLSELRYEQSTMSKRDVQTIAAHMQNPHERISPAQYEFYTVHGGSPIESMEGAMDRALYLISYFPIYSTHTHLLDQLPRQRCYMTLQEQLLERFDTRQQNRTQQDIVSADDAELYYYVYQKALKSDQLSKHQLNELRLLTMKLLLEQSKTSLLELDQLMNAPYVSMPQDDNGFWMTGPLNYPDNPDSMNLIIYKSFEGYSLNPKTGDIQLMLTRWMPGDKPEERLFTHDDLLALIEGGVGRAIFSLDANSVYRQYDPLQIVRFSPQSLKDTEYLRSLFATDYIMKMISQGTEINARPPYNTRPIDALFEGLDKSIQEELLACPEKTANDEDFKSHATRFWIQMGAIPRVEKERGYCILVRYGDPEVTIKKQLLTLDAQGHLVDAPIDLNDKSREARFASAFTKYYGKIAEQLPIFNQLKAFYTISGAIQELQEKRLRNKRGLVVHKHQLDNAEHWQQEKAKKRKEWNEINWDDYLAKRIDLLTRLVKDDAHWERLIEDSVKMLERKRVALESKQGEEYQHTRAHFLKMYQALGKKIYEEEPRLHWTLTHPDFKQHCDRIRQTVFEQIKAEDKNASIETLQKNLELFLNPNKEFTTIEEAILHKIKANAKNRLLENLVFFKEAMGVTSYNEATVKFLRGDISPMVRMQAEYEVSRILANEENSPEATSFLETLKQRVLAETKRELLKQLSSDTLQILDQSITKSSYATDDPVFIVFYNKRRAEIRQQQIQINQRNIPNWSQFETQYLTQIDNLLDRDFSKQSQLIKFNQLVTQVRQQQKMKWVMQILSESPTILSQFGGEIERVETAVEALLNGNPEHLALAQMEMIFQELKATTNTAIKTHIGQKIWEQLLTQEVETQTKIMTDVLKTIYSKPKEKQQCPDYAYLKPYFAELAYQEAIDSFSQGDTNAFVESQVAFALEQRKKELSGDLYLKAKEEVDAARYDLENNISIKAKQHVDNLKSALINNMEGQLEAYVEEAKESLREAIADGNRLEASFSRIKLGKSEKMDASSNTEFRVPAIFSKCNDRYVYGGVNAIPSFKAVEKLDEESRKLTFVSSEWDIWNAKRTLNNINCNFNSLNLNIMLAKQGLEQAIRMAELQLALNKIGIGQFNLASNYQLELQKFTMGKLEQAPETTKTSLLSWRATGSAFQEVARMTLSNVVHNTTAVFKGTLQGLDDILNMFVHPIDNVLKPTAHLAADALVIAVAHFPPLATIQQFCNPDEAAALSEVCRVIKNNRGIYEDAVMNMQNRFQQVQQSVTTFSQANQAEQYQMAARAITTFVAPGVLIKAASAAKTIIHRTSLADSPMLLKNSKRTPDGNRNGQGSGGTSSGNGGDSGNTPPLFPPGSIGAAKVWSTKTRLSALGLPNEGKVRYIPPEGYDPKVPLPRGNHGGYIDRFGNEWVKGPTRTKGHDFEWDVRLSRAGENYFAKLEAQFGPFVRKLNDGPYINVSPFGHITH